MARVILFGRDADDDAGIGVPFGARILAHAIGDDAAGLRGGGDHGAAGAHAEGIDRAAIAGVVDEFVVGGTEDAVAGEVAEAGAVDDRLRVFDAHADGKRLGLDMHAAVEQHLEGVARRMADGEDDMVGLDRLAGFGDDAAHAAEAVAAGLDDDVGDLRAEAVFTAQGFDLGAQAFDHGDQAEGADMRLGDEEDLLGRAGGDEFGQHLAGDGFGRLDAGIELAVGEGSGAALAELHIAFGHQHAAAPQAPGVLGAFAHHLAAVEDDRAVAHLGEDQRGEDAAGAGADDDRALPGGGGCVGDGAVARVGRRAEGARQDLVARGLPQQGGFVGDLDVHGIDQEDVGPLARIPGAAGDMHGAQRVAMQAELRAHFRLDRPIGVIEGQFEFRQP